MFTKKFLKQTAERAVKTFAQTNVAFFLGVQTISQIGGWDQYLVIAVIPTGLSVLSSIASSTVGDKDSASALDEAE